MGIQTVGVVGAGLMGAGIIEQTARCGYSVLAREIDESAAAQGRQRIETSMARGMQRGKLTENERSEASQRISWTVDLRDLRDCDLVIEAVVENLDLKREIFAELDAVT